MKIGLVSLNQAWENKELNMQNCEFFVNIAASHSVKLIVFPEM